MLRFLQCLLWGVALMATAIYAGTTAERWISQAYLDWEFAKALEPPVPAAPKTARIPDGLQPLGRLEIPSIGLSALFIEGADSVTLRRGIGHIPGTALPGAMGDAALSAHRDTFFRRLREISKGDKIWITTRQGRYKYVVDTLQIVNPDQRLSVQTIGPPTLTLVTCYPFYYVGPAPKRFLVHAALSDREADLDGAAKLLE
jgi:sortase A